MVPWIHSPEYTFFIYSGFLSKLRLSWKTELPWNFLLYWIYFLHSEYLRNLSLPWKTICPEFTVLNIYFLLFRIFEQLALALKNRIALEFFTVLNMYFLSFRIFEQLALALKTEFALTFFKSWGRPPLRLCAASWRIWNTCNCKPSSSHPFTVLALNYLALGNWKLVNTTTFCLHSINSTVANLRKGEFPRVLKRANQSC